VSFFSVPRQTAAIAFAISLGLHGAVGMWVKVRSTGTDGPEPARPDVWAGRGIEIDRTELEAAPADVSESETNEAPAVEPVERTIGVEAACVSDCVSEQRAKADKPRAAASNSAPVPPATVRSVAAPSAAAPSSSATASSSAASSDASATPASEAFGALGLPPGVRSLPKAWARALNQGSWGVAGFRTASPGKLCEARVSITVGEDRKLGPLEYSSERERDALPALCRTMLENGYRLVSSGEFSLDPKRLESGVMRLRIEVEVSDGAAHPEAERGPNELFGESHEAPSPGKRGRSTFILNSGRRVDAFLDIE
jgi:hypothetical protein